LKNGNILITNEHDTLTVEVSPKKEIAWSLRPSDLRAEYRYLNTQSATRLANGNTIIASHGGNGKGPQLVESDARQEGRVGAARLDAARAGDGGADTRRFWRAEGAGESEH